MRVENPVAQIRELPAKYQTGSNMKYVIACPHHGKIETIEVPDDGKADFTGEVSCGDEDAPKPLRIEIVRERLVEVDRA